MKDRKHVNGLRIPRNSSVHYDFLAAHAPVACDSSLMILLLLTDRHNLKLKQMDVKTAFTNSPLEHDEWVRLTAVYEHPSGNALAKLHKLLYGLKKAASD